MNNKINTIFLCAIFYSGFVTNFVTLSNVNTGTILIDLFMIIYLLIFCVKRYNSKKFFLNYGLIILIIILISIFLFKFIIDKTSIEYKIQNIHNMLFYLLIFVWVQATLNSKEEIKKMILSIRLLGVLLSGFAIIQYLFRNILPIKFLVLNQDKIFSYIGTDFIRVNGLIGNTIVFGTFSLIIYSLNLNILLRKINAKNYILTFISIISTILSFSRVAIIGMIVLSAFYIMFFKKNIKIMIAFIVMLILGILVLNIGFKNVLTFMVNDVFTNSNISVKGSTDKHFNQIQLAMEYIKNNWFIGSGLGANEGSFYGNIIIYDGAWYSLLLDYGLVLFIPYVCFIFYSMIFSIKLINKNIGEYSSALVITYIGISFWVLIIGFINSSFLAKVVYLTFWLIFGCVISIHRKFEMDKKLYRKTWK